MGVTQLPFDTSDEEIVRLNKLGVRALRFNVNRGGSEDISRLDYFARRVYDWFIGIPNYISTLPNCQKLHQL